MKSILISIIHLYLCQVHWIPEWEMPCQSTRMTGSSFRGSKCCAWGGLVNVFLMYNRQSFLPIAALLTLLSCYARYQHYSTTFTPHSSERQRERQRGLVKQTFELDVAATEHQDDQVANGPLIGSSWEFDHTAWINQAQGDAREKSIPDFISCDSWSKTPNIHGEKKSWCVLENEQCRCCHTCSIIPHIPSHSLILNSNKITGSVSNYTLWNIWSKHSKVTCSPGRIKNIWSHLVVSHSLRTTGWRKAALGQPRWNPSRELGLQHFWPEELYPGCSPAVCVRAHSSGGHGPPQYRGTPAGAPHRPAGPVPSPRWGLSKAFCEFEWCDFINSAQQPVPKLISPQYKQRFSNGISSATEMCDLSFLVSLEWCS